MPKKIMDKKVAIGVIIIVAVVLVITWWLGSPLFLDKIVNEEFPAAGDKIETNNSSIIAKLEGQFVDADNFHKTSGTAKIIIVDDKKFLSLENFETTNGPDLYVYLSTDKSSEDYANLGRLKGNVGDQNYEISDDIDLENYNTAVIWCRAFSVLFGSAELQ